MTENYEAHRGRELITFSDYCIYEALIQKHVNNLKLPALDTLKSVRGNVKSLPLCQVNIHTPTPSIVLFWRVTYIIETD